MWAQLRSKKTVRQRIVLCKHKVYCKCAVVSKHHSEQLFKDTLQQQYRYLYKTRIDFSIRYKQHFSL